MTFLINRINKLLIGGYVVLSRGEIYGSSVLGKEIVKRLLPSEGYDHSWLKVLKLEEENLLQLKKKANLRTESI